MLGSAMDWSLKPHANANANANTNLDVSSMDSSFKPFISTASCDVDNNNLLLLDRLTSLPDELLIRIFSLLPTKDVAATCFLNSRLSLLFPFITSLDFDANPISFCVQKPSAIRLYPAFVSFVNSVLQTHKSLYLTRFRLHTGHSCSFFTPLQFVPRCTLQCLPPLNSSLLTLWLSFPFNLSGLRELDLSVLLRESGDAQLPPAIFTCPTLEVLKLDVNLGLDLVFSVPSYHLPNLRFLSLRASFLSDDAFLPRLLSSCPLLEDLTYTIFPRHHLTHVIIHSASLKRLSLVFEKLCEFERDNTDFVIIHTPALEYLNYYDTLALCYSIPIMHCLVTTKLNISEISDYQDIEVTHHQLLSLITSVSYVQRLYLAGIFIVEFRYDDVKDQFPMLPNLKYLELGYASDEYYWNTFLLHLLNRSPVLEILVLPLGLLDGYIGCDFDRGDHKLEKEFLRTVHPIPSCCRDHLKRIVIMRYRGLPREVEIVQFFLRHALVLEELIIYLDKAPVKGYPIPNQILVENSLMSLPKASVTCSIQVQW